MRSFRHLLLTISLVVVTHVSAQTLTCSSNDGGRHFCRANTSNGVQLARQRSGSACIQGSTWGYDSGGIWVDKGCRADFALYAQRGPAAGMRPAGISPDEAMRTCKNTASGRLPNVPMAYIDVQRGSDAGDGNYMINFRAQPPNARSSSGFCNIGSNGRVISFQFDPGSGPGGNPASMGGSGGGRVPPQEAMRSCKSEVSARRPNVPLAFISVDQPRKTGNAEYMVNFRAVPPDGPASSGFCNISQDGRVDVRFDRPAR